MGKDPALAEAARRELAEVRRRMPRNPQKRDDRQERAYLNGREPRRMEREAGR